jgi:hypothetical protein
LQKKTDCLIDRQPGYLIETRGFPSLPHDRFGLLLWFLLPSLRFNVKQILYIIFM